MKKLKTISQIKKDDYIKIYNNRKGFIVFKSKYDWKHSNTAIIKDTNIEGLEGMIGKEEHISDWSLEHEFKVYRLNKFERWLYEI